MYTSWRDWCCLPWAVRLHDPAGRVPAGVLPSPDLFPHAAMPPTCYDLSAFGSDHFAAAQLGDCRRTRSLVDQANRLVKHPQGSLPHKLKDPNALRRLYDLMNTKAVTHAAVLQPHVQHTAGLLLDHTGVALCLHDTTEIDLTGHTSLHPELGQIGDGNGRGYECHNSLVVLPHGRRVLGLLAQQLHCRAWAPKGETPAQRRERDSRESLLWPQGAAAARLAVERACRDRRLAGPPPAWQLVDVCDRGGDTFEFLDYEHDHDRHYVVRSEHNREVRIGHDPGGAEAKLHDHLRRLPEQGRRTITVRDHQTGQRRPATVAIAWAAVVLVPPHQQCGFSRRLPLAVWCVRVWEVGPPAGAEAIEWFLLTNVAVHSAADAWERVEWYCTRWVVEEYHKALKTGCDLEGPQFETAAAMQPMLALLSVVALSLLNLRDRSRDPQLQDRPAREVMAPEEVEVLSGWRYGERRELTTREFFLALARLGGHQNRQRDHLPGWLVLWRGWQALQLLVAGARAARALDAADAAKGDEKVDPSG
jgi:hypothetical protein